MRAVRPVVRQELVIEPVPETRALRAEIMAALSRVEQAKAVLSRSHSELPRQPPVPRGSLRSVPDGWLRYVRRIDEFTRMPAEDLPLFPGLAEPSEKSLKPRP